MTTTIEYPSQAKLQEFYPQCWKTIWLKDLEKLLYIQQFEYLQQVEATIDTFQSPKNHSARFLDAGFGRRQ